MKNYAIYFLVLFCFQMQGQNCNDDNHSTNINDSWVSCDVSENPNPMRSESHWIMYDLGYAYSLGTTHFWNYNVSGETAKGMKNIKIDLSLDGSNWNEAASFRLEEADGTNDYRGEEGPHLGGTDARYILLTAVDTWGDDCAGLSEVRFDIEGVVSSVEEIREEHHSISIFPNPATQSIAIETEMDLKEIILVNIAGKELTRTSYAPKMDISYLPNGVYFLKGVNEANEVFSTRFIKQGIE